MGGYFPQFGSLSEFQSVPQSSSLTTMSLLGLLGEVDRKPRNRSEWENRFEVWQRPASETEEQRITATTNRVHRALQYSQFLLQRNWKIVPQGSHHNNTNTRAESDIDLCLCLTDAFFVDGPPYDWPSNDELKRKPVQFTFDQFRNHIGWCLQQEFGADAVKVGNKAIHLNKDCDDKINADIVPAFVFEQYGPRMAPYWLRDEPNRGIAFLTRNEQRRVTNFPEQHYRNGVAKNNRTGGRFKRVVRILKRIRNHITDNLQAPQVARTCAKTTPSFLIESLIFNCPDALFGHTSIYDDVVAVLYWLRAGLNNRDPVMKLLNMLPWMQWKEVNQVKALFGYGQEWSIEGATAFVDVALAYLEV